MIDKIKGNLKECIADSKDVFRKIKKEMTKLFKN